MGAQPSHEMKLFTVEQANAALPLVRAIVKDLAELSIDVADRRERLSALVAGRQGQVGDPYHDELSHVQDELEKDLGRLQDFVEELRQLGVEPKNGPQGLVDFPCMMDGRIVYLCWRLGEPEVLFWHDIEAGFAGRQPLVAGAASDGNSDRDDESERR